MRVASLLAVTLATSVAHAGPAPIPPSRSAPEARRAADAAVSGELRPASTPGDSGRRVLDGLLALPRSLLDLAVSASAATAWFVEDQQIVPRVREVLGAERALRWAPTFTLSSSLQPEVGARVTSRSPRFSSMLRGSILDQDAFLSEGRMILALGKDLQTQLSLEGYLRRDGYLTFVGVGSDPGRDPRNAFLPGQEGQKAEFLESRERLIAGASARVSTNVEVLLSSSLQLRKVEDPSWGGTDTIAGTFAPGSVPGAYDRSVRVYSEVAARRDTRAVRGPPAKGVLLEAYMGASGDPQGDYAYALHAGGRAALFTPVVRQTSILNPGITLDSISPVGAGRLPFREYLRASGFRGEDDRVDLVALLASLDYRWQLRSFVAARLFVDLTTVAPRFASLRLDHLAWAAGGAIDLHTRNTELGRIGLVYSRHSVQLVFVYGVAGRGFGDRQHR